MCILSVRIFWRANTAAIDKRRLASAGIDAVFSKPIEVELLLKSVETLLGSAQYRELAVLER